MNNDNQIDDGGPAFPNPPNANWEGCGGMSLRDWFAGQASEEDIEAHLGGQIHPHTGRIINPRSREKAKYAYADEMIAVRKGGQQ